MARPGSGLSQQFGGRAALGPSRWDLGGRAAAPGGRVRVFCVWCYFFLVSLTHLKGNEAKGKGKESVKGRRVSAREPAAVL